MDETFFLSFISFNAYLLETETRGFSQIGPNSSWTVPLNIPLTLPEGEMLILVWSACI